MEDKEYINILKDGIKNKKKVKTESPESVQFLQELTDELLEDLNTEESKKK